MSHEDKNELTKEELAAMGVEKDEMSLLANLGIFVAIIGVAIFVAIAGLAMWNFMADALTREVNSKTKLPKKSMLADGQLNALTAKATHAALFNDKVSFSVKGGKLAPVKVKRCEPGSAVLCDTIMYRRNQKLLVLQGGKTAKGATVLPIAAGMKRLLANPRYLVAVTDKKPAARKPAPVRKPAVRPTTRSVVKTAPTTRPSK